MNTQNKFDILAKLPAYWAKRYPDAFLEQGGKEVFREDLLDFLQDREIAEAHRRISSLVDAMQELSLKLEVPAIRKSLAPIIVFTALWPFLILGAAYVWVF